MKIRRLGEENGNQFSTVSLSLLMILGLWVSGPIVAVSAADLVTFMLSDGDIVTCLPFAEQPSLQNQTNPEQWMRMPTTEIIPGSSTNNTRGALRAQQTLAVEQGSCPEGTIPRRQSRWTWGSQYSRVSAHGDESSGSRGMKTSAPSKYAAGSVAATGEYWTVDPLNSPHEWSVASINPSLTESGGYKGTEVFLNLWDPFVEDSSEFSLAQLWVITRSPGPTNTVEAGYQISTGHYGDSRPRLFTFWTADYYSTTGCYELDCPGFVQVSNKVLLGGSFQPTSQAGGQQYEVKLRVFKDDQTGDWWLQVNEDIVGYWPQNLFGDLQGLAQELIWGGEIVDNQPSHGGYHTRTQMGSGEFASAGFEKAAYQRNLQYINIDNTLVDAPVQVFNSSAPCYSVQQGDAFPEWGTYIFYGGKGRNTNCLTDPRYNLTIAAPPVHLNTSMTSAAPRVHLNTCIVTKILLNLCFMHFQGIGGLEKPLFLGTFLGRFIRSEFRFRFRFPFTPMISPTDLA